MVLGPSWRERLRAACRRDRLQDNDDTHSTPIELHSRAPVTWPPSCHDSIVELIPEFRLHWIPPFTLSSAYGGSSSTRESSIYSDSSISNRPPLIRQNASAHLPATFFSQLRSRHAWQSTPHGTVLTNTLPSPQDWSRLSERAVREPLNHYEYPAINIAFPPAYTVLSHQSPPTSQPSRPNSHAAPRPNPHSTPCLRRLPRLPTRRAETATSNDPPPPYQIVDPHHPPTSRIRFHDSVIVRAFKQVRRDGAKVTSERIGKSMVKHIEDMGQTAKDLPKVIKDARQNNRVKRAKTKLFWLEKHNFMSGQDRILMEEVER
jgi:hypothetical protein